MRLLLLRYRISLLSAAIALTAASLFAASVSKPFTPQQRRWWAFQKVTRPATPAVKDASAARNEIDRFVLAKLEEKGIAPNPLADRVTLLRRASLDMTGLPPTPEELQSFLNDTSPNAYEKVVDRLLASPHYGERWGRHWLDLARYADSEGFKSDETRPNIWRYRDYVINSLNADKPYNRFVQEQIAGDELFPNDPAALIATGFNRHFPDESNARNVMQRRQELLNDITDVVGSTFLGMTYGCARCHDHKFDPILQKDYYRLQAFFANTAINDQAFLLSGEKRREWEAKYAVWEAKTKDIRAEMQKLVQPVMDSVYKDNFSKFPEEIQAAITMPAAQRTPYQWQMYLKSKWTLTLSETDAANRLEAEPAKRYAELKKQLAAFDDIKPEEKPVAQAMVDHGAESPKTFLLNAGAYNSPQEEVQPGFLSILDPSDAKITPLPDLPSTGRRSALAKWLTDPENPLTARVIVNRVWHYHFGTGLVATPSDFGVMGERPVNRELLDYLASTFVENGWSLKKLHRSILLSSTYQRSSNFNEASAKIDPNNKYQWRFQRRRLEGEDLRDSMLEVSGLLNTKAGGPGVFPPLPEGVVTRGGWKRNEDPAEATRRSVYVFVRRNTRYPMFEAFDMPDTHESCARRSQTVTPSQSLELLNNDLVLDWSKALAARVLNDSGLTPEAQIDRAYKLVYSRTPSADERQAALSFLDRHTPLLAERASNNEKLTVPANLPHELSPVRAAAFVDLCHMLLNSNEFLYIN
jgi:hypothetical protein